MTAQAGVLLPGVVEFVLIPLGVNLAASVLVELIRRVVKAARPGLDVDHLEIMEKASPSGEQVMVVQLLRWYFEEHLRYPFLDQDLESAAAALVAEHGRCLFSQVFVGEAQYGYRRLRDAGFDGCRLVVEGSARFHRLHWEALRDPDQDRVLALAIPVVRRVDRVPIAFDIRTDQPVVNILVVTARPHGAADVGYRTISRPLMDALRQARLPVTVDIVRPGTWEALRDHLRQTSQERGTG